MRSLLGVIPERRVLYSTTDRGRGESVLRLLSIESGQDRELLRVAAPETLMFLDVLADGKSVFVSKNRPVPSGSQVWRVALEGTEPNTRVALTENLSDFRTLGVSKSGIYLGKWISSGPLGIWQLSADGALMPLDVTRDVVRPIGRLMTVSPDRGRVALITGFRPPAAPLAVWVFEGGVAQSPR